MMLVYQKDILAKKVKVSQTYINPKQNLKR